MRALQYRSHPLFQFIGEAFQPLVTRPTAKVNDAEDRDTWRGVASNLDVGFFSCCL